MGWANGAPAMKVLYTISMDRRHAQETELLTRVVEDGVKSFNLLMLANSKVEDVRLVTDRFHEGEAVPTRSRPRSRP